MNTKNNHKMLDKFYAKYAPTGEAQRKEFVRQFRRCANIYATVQGHRINALEKENAELKRLLFKSVA